MSGRPFVSTGPPLPFAGLLDLPYDIILELFAFLSTPDLVHLLSCCRTLYALTQQESIWKHLSGLWGLYDIAYFGGRSFYTVYTGLLHTYAPLIGLWASDQPYTGDILEFRLKSGSEHHTGGIEGGIWRFRVLEPEETDRPEAPELPKYSPLFWIGFSEQIPPHDRHHEHAQISCSSSRIHLASINVMSETTQRIFLHSRQGQFSLPDFPGADTDAWLDKHHSFPRLPITPQNRIDQSERLPQTSRLRSPVVFTVPTDHVKPIAISVYCQSGCLRRRRPFLGFENHVPFHPRYYPLRSTVRLGIEPRAEQWSPESLIGLWLGSHGPHGTECLYVEWDEIQSTLRGWKITGDENVPRGALSWDVSTARLYQVSSTQSDLFTRSFGTSPIARLYEGTGTVSARGFMPHQQNHLSLVMGVDEPDVFRILWIEVEEVSMYIRYKGGIAADR